jgi:hypothetical protein
MAEIEFAHLFPEWVLSWSLHQACKNASEFWNLRIVHSVAEPENPKTFSILFPSSTKVPVLYFEKPFKKEEAEIYGIPEITYEMIFWGLRVPCPIPFFVYSTHLQPKRAKPWCNLERVICSLQKVEGGVNGK